MTAAPVSLSGGVQAASRGSGPIRLLHLLDPATGGEGAVLACHAATQIPGIRHDVWLLGSARAARLAALAGLREFQSVTITADVPETAVRSLWRLRSAAARDGGGPIDAVIAWSPATVSLASAVFARPVSFPIVGVFPVSPAAAMLGWLPRLARRRLNHCARRATVVPIGDSLQRNWTAALGLGVTAIVPPIADISHITAHRDAARRELGIEPDELAALLIADPPMGGDVRRFAQIIGMSRLTGRAVIGLVHAGTPQWDRAQRFAHVSRRAWNMIRFEGPMLGALAAADICVWDTTTRLAGQTSSAGGQVLPLAAAAAGIPVIARDEPLTHDVIGAAPACMVINEKEHLFAARVVDMADYPGLRAESAAALRAHHASDDRRWKFHAELLDSLRIITSTARTTAEWWSSLETGVVA